MKRYNINIIEHDIDRAINKDYTDVELCQLCEENSYEHTYDFSELYKTYNTIEEARADFEKLKPETIFFGDRHTVRGTLRIRGYILEEALCDDETKEQYEWSFIDMKFEAFVGEYLN